MTASLANQLEQASARMLVVLVLFEVISKPIDALGQKSYLDLGRPRVTGMPVELLHNSTFFRFGQRHTFYPF